MEKHQMTEEFCGLFFLLLKMKGVGADWVAMYTHVFTQINQIINKFVVLGVGVPDKGRLRVNKDNSTAQNSNSPPSQRMEYIVATYWSPEAVTAGEH